MRFWNHVFCDQNDPQNTLARTRHGGFYDFNFWSPRATFRHHLGNLGQGCRKRARGTVARRRRSYALRVPRMI